MKKIIVIVVSILIIATGCENIRNTPTGKVEEFLSKYQRMDMDVLEDLKISISKDKTMSEEQKKEYQTLLEKQYQNLSYKIKKEETITKDRAIVETEIEVFDYLSAITSSKRKYKEYQKEYSTYTDYKISEMKKVTTRVKKEITFQLEKEKGLWKIKELNQNDLAKIHGLS